MQFAALPMKIDFTMKLHAFFPAWTAMRRCCPLVLAMLIAAFSVPVNALPVGSTGASSLQLGDCVMFREGGAGVLFKTPTYWLRGLVADVSPERRLARRCPVIGKLMPAYTRQDWIRVAAAMPCVDNDADVRDVEVLRVRVAVEAWETPWSTQHGTAAWLFRGYFLDQVLSKGGLIEMDSSWLERCEHRP